MAIMCWSHQTPRLWRRSKSCRTTGRSNRDLEADIADARRGHVRQQRLARQHARTLMERWHAARRHTLRRRQFAVQRDVPAAGAIQARREPGVLDLELVCECLDPATPA